MLKKLYILYGLLTAIALKTSAQELVFVPGFGDISLADLQMKECSFEKGAEAMNLLKFEKVDFTRTDNNFYKVTTERRFRIKIFNTNGFKYANIALPYIGGYKDYKITDIDGAAYNLDEGGQVKISKLDKDEIFNDKGKKKKGLNAMRFTFPDVKAGCIIELRFTIVEKNSSFISPWYFQDNIPTRLSACVIGIPIESALEKRVIGPLQVEEGLELDLSKGFERRKKLISYAIRDIPSLKPEPFMSSANDIKQKAEFILNPYETTFEATIKKSDKGGSQINMRLLFSPFFGWQFETPIPGTEQFIDSKKKLTAVSEKVNAVYQYVKKNIIWDKSYSIYSGFLADVWKEKSGTSAEINLSILNLLRKSGVDCYPLIFSTRENGKTDYQFPNLRQFNNVDVLVFDGDMYYILDGTLKNQPFSIPPFNILSRDAFVVDGTYSKWVNVVDPRPLLRDSVYINAAIDKDGILTRGKAVTTYYDIAKANKLDEENDDEDAEENATANSEVKIDTVYTVNRDDELLPLIETMEFHYELPSTDDFYFLSPFLFTNLSKNPFTDTLRRSDVDFGANTYDTVFMEIALPQNIKLEELMKNTNIRTEDTSIHFSCVSNLAFDTIRIKSVFEINKPIFPKRGISVGATIFS